MDSDENFDWKLWSSFAKVNNFLKENIFNRDKQERPSTYCASEEKYQHLKKNLRKEISVIKIENIEYSNATACSIDGDFDVADLCETENRINEMVDEGTFDRFIYCNPSAITNKNRPVFWKQIFALKKVPMFAHMKSDEEFDAFYQKTMEEISDIKASDSRYKKLLATVQSIDKDVVRLEQSNESFKVSPGCKLILEDEDSLIGGFDSGNANINQIRNVLVAFSFVVQQSPDSYFGLEYTQGMADICWVFYRIFDGDAKAVFCAFFSFVHVKQRYFANDSAALKFDLQVLRKLLDLFDEELFDFLKKRKALNMFFCYRWIVLFFKREFDCIEDLCRVWEAMFANPLTSKFHIFVMLAVILMHAKELMRAVSALDVDYEDQMEQIMKYFDTLHLPPVIEIITSAEVLLKKFNAVSSLLYDSDLKQLRSFSKEQTGTPK